MKLNRMVSGVLAFLSLASPTAASGAEARDWKVSASVNYETGAYGSSATTETWYLPLTVKKMLADGSFISVTVPYVSQRGDASVAAVDGSVFQINQSTGPVATNSGLGDIVLRGGYRLMAESKQVPADLTLTGKLKLPTADETKGLGTGELDAGFGFELAKSLPSGFTGYIDLYYTATGDPPGLDLEDRVFFDIGFSRALQPGWTVCAFYEESNALVKGATRIRNLTANLEYKVDAGTRMFFGGTAGLTETSPDYGLAIGVSLLL